MIMKNILEKLKNPKTMMTAKGKKISSVTILVCTPDLNSELTVKCIESVKKYTPDTINYELLIFDNGKFGSFQHPLEINRAMDIARGDVLVTLDDDVEVTEGWLESMLKLARPDVGVVGCYQLNSQEHAKDTVRHVGGWVDGKGKVFHHTKKIKAPINVPFVGSACFLINDESLRFSLDYKKYYQEVDLCLRSWEKGKKVVVA
ncbi:MAG: glycosyltransferase, partial [bacterium]|nr:glycosyltransferase [bacterium]